MSAEHRRHLPVWLGALVFVALVVNVAVFMINIGARPDVWSAHVARPLITLLREQGVNEEVRGKVARAIFDAGNREGQALRRGTLAAVLSTLALILIWEIAVRRLKMQRSSSAGTKVIATVERPDASC